MQRRGERDKEIPWIPSDRWISHSIGHVFGSSGRNFHGTLVHILRRLLLVFAPRNYDSMDGFNFSSPQSWFPTKNDDYAILIFRRWQLNTLLKLHIYIFNNLSLRKIYATFATDDPRTAESTQCFSRHKTNREEEKKEKQVRSTHIYFTKITKWKRAKWSRTFNSI